MRSGLPQVDADARAAGNAGGILAVVGQTQAIGGGHAILLYVPKRAPGRVIQRRVGIMPRNGKRRHASFGKLGSLPAIACDRVLPGNLGGNVWPKSETGSAAHSVHAPLKPCAAKRLPLFSISHGVVNPTAAARRGATPSSGAEGGDPIFAPRTSQKSGQSPGIVRRIARGPAGRGRLWWRRTVLLDVERRFGRDPDRREDRGVQVFDRDRLVGQIGTSRRSPRRESGPEWCASAFNCVTEMALRLCGHYARVSSPEWGRCTGQR